METLFIQGRIKEIYAKEPEYKKFADRFAKLQSLADMQDQAFEASLKPSISTAGSRPLDALNPENLTFLFEMKMRDANAKTGGPAPQETQQLALHTQA